MLSIRADHTAKTPWSKDQIPWQSEHKKLDLTFKYVPITLKGTMHNDQKSMSITRYYDQEPNNSYHAIKISDAADYKSDLFELCTDKSDETIWKCMNVGYGEDCIGTNPGNMPNTTSLTLSGCRDKCVALLEYRKGMGYPHAKLESCEKH